MSFSVVVAKSATLGATGLSASTTHTCQSVSQMEETVADGASDASYLLSVDISALKCFAMLADQDLTVKFYDGAGTLGETLSLTADKPFIWETGETAYFSSDYVEIRVSNSSGSAATLEALVGSDT